MPSVGTFAYFSDRAEGTLYRMALETTALGAQELLLDGCEDAGDIAADHGSAFVYFTCKGCASLLFPNSFPTRIVVLSCFEREIRVLKLA